ncbi:hypothetical protein J3R30DRAFT_3539157 [Lentinula aciculospora]|uniref:Uncharacterized protein n=1 Tax=Lentinula aciculospora TaxID=153920 RepID=A0A9W9DH35_9AGAR|nr:hypothetical protein J3R30DRAFT_3539157 [Lentinula aciculospora]
MQDRERPKHCTAVMLKQLQKLVGRRKRNNFQESGNSGIIMGTDKSRTKNRRGEFFSALSGVTDLALVALRDAASLAPIPYISLAAELAIDIWDSVQAAQDNKSSLHTLGSDAISLVYAVIATCDEVLNRHRQKRSNSDTPKLEDEDVVKKDEKELSAEVNNEELSPELRRNLERLCCTLTEIDSFAKHVASRNAFLRFLTARADTGKVEDFQSKMKMALDLFTLQSNITLRQVTSRIEIQQAQLLTTLQCPISPTSDPLVLGLSAEVPASAGHAATENSIGEDLPHVLPGNAARPGAASVAFPAIFSFAGATFQTGDAGIVHPTPPREEEEPKEEDKDGELKETTNEPSVISEHRAPRGNSSGGITFTSIAGDQTISWVNDQSRKWNYGNVYSSSDGPRTETGSMSGRPADEDGAWLGGQSRSPFTALQSERLRSYDINQGHGLPHVASMYNGRRLAHFPSQTYYDENGIPTAIPQNNGRSSRRRRVESLGRVGALHRP